MASWAMEGSGPGGVTSGVSTSQKGGKTEVSAAEWPTGKRWPRSRVAEGGGATGDRGFPFGLGMKPVAGQWPGVLGQEAKAAPGMLKWETDQATQQ